MRRIGMNTTSRQRPAFATYVRSTPIRAEQYLRYLERFPEGQFVLTTRDTLSADSQTGSRHPPPGPSRGDTPPPGTIIYIGIMDPIGSPGRKLVP
jgi:hypothetical protein